MHDKIGVPCVFSVHGIHTVVITQHANAPI